jgi:hypothetical protein
VEPIPWCYRRQRGRLGPNLNRAETRESWWGSPEAGAEAEPRSTGEVCRRQAVEVRYRGHDQESRCRRTGGTWGLTRPHGDGFGPWVVERRPALDTTQAGGTSAGGVATPASALVGATASVGGAAGRVATSATVGGRAGALVEEVRGACPPEDA